MNFTHDANGRKIQTDKKLTGGNRPGSTSTNHQYVDQTYQNNPQTVFKGNAAYKSKEESKPSFGNNSQVSIPRQQSRPAKKFQSKSIDITEALQIFFDHSKKDYDGSFKLFSSHSMAGTQKLIQQSIIELLQNERQLRFDLQKSKENQENLINILSQISNQKSYLNLFPNQSLVNQKLNEIIKISNSWKVIENIDYTRTPSDIQVLSLTASAKHILKQIISAKRGSSRHLNKPSVRQDPEFIQMQKDFNEYRQAYAKLHTRLESERVKNTGRRRDDKEEVQYFNKINQLKNHLYSEQQRLKDLQRGIEDKLSQNKLIERQIIQKNRVKDQLLSEISSTERQLDVVKLSLRETEANLTRVGLEVKSGLDRQNQIRVLLEEKQQLAQIITKITDQNQKLKDKNKYAQQRLTSQTNFANQIQISRNQQALQLKRSKKEIEESKRMFEDKLTESQIEIQKLEVQNKALKVSISKLQEEIGKKQAQKDEEQQNYAIKSQNKQLSTEIQMLKISHNELKRQNEQLLLKNSSLQSLKIGLEKQLSSKKVENTLHLSRMNKQFTQEQEKVQIVRKEKENLEKENKQYLKTITQMQRKIPELEEELQKGRIKNEELLAQVKKSQSLNSQNQRLSWELNDLKALFDKTEKTANELGQNNKKLEEELSKKTTSLDRIEGQLQREKNKYVYKRQDLKLKAEEGLIIEQLRSQARESQQEKQTLKGKLGQQEMFRVEAESKINQLRQQLQFAKEQFRQKQRSISGYIDKIKEYQSDNLKTQEEIVQKLALVNKLEKQKDELQRGYHKNTELLKLNLAQQGQKIVPLQAQINRLTNIIENITHQNHSLKTMQEVVHPGSRIDQSDVYQVKFHQEGRMAEAEQQIRHLCQELQGKQQAIAKLNENLGQQAIQLKNLRSENNQLKEQAAENIQYISNLQKDRQVLYSDANALWSDNQLFRKDLEQKEEMINRMNCNDEHMSALQAETNVLKEKSRQKDSFIINLEKKIQALTSQKEEFERQLNQREEQLNQLKRTTEILNKQIVSLKTTIESQQLKANSSKREIEGKLSFSDEIKKKLQERNRTNEYQLKKISQLKNKAQTLSERVDVLERRLKAKETEIASLNEKMKEVSQNKERQVDFLKEQMKEREITYQTIDQNKIDLLENYQTLRKEYKAIVLIKDLASGQEKKARAESSKLKIRLNQLEQQNRRQMDNENKSRKSEKIIQELKESKGQLQVKVKALQEKEKGNLGSSRFERDRGEQARTSLELRALKEQVENLKGQVSDRDKRLREKQQEIDDMKKEKSEGNERMIMRGNPSMAETDSLSSVRHLFHGQVLRGNDEHKLFLKNSIQNLTRIRIVDTRLIYRYDPLNLINMHRYIDEKEQLVVVIRLSNYHYMAAYTEGLFKPKTPSDKEGMLVSLTNKKCYYLAERNRRATVYDDYFLIFGNSQLRIKTQQKKIFSNFGLNSNYYKNNGEGMPELLGGTKTQRELQFQSCEIFQLIIER